MTYYVSGSGVADCRQPFLHKNCPYTGAIGVPKDVCVGMEVVAKVIYRQATNDDCYANFYQHTLNYYKPVDSRIFSQVTHLTNGSSILSQNSPFRLILLEKEVWGLAQKSIF